MMVLRKMTNFTSEGCLKTGSRVNVFYRKEDCPFLKDNAVMLDVPGIDTDVRIDEDIVEYCSEADIIILVVNSVQCIKKSVINFITKFKTRFTKLNVFLVYNHWDRLDGEDNREEVKCQLIENAKIMYKNELKYTNDEIKERYFFLSAKEQTNFRIKENINRDIRDDDFATFKNKLQEEMGKDTFRRRYEYLEELYNVIVENVKECDNIFLKCKTNISLMLENSKKLLKTFSYSLEQMGRIIKPPLEDIFQTCLEMRKESQKSNGRSKSNSNISRKKKGKQQIKQFLKGNKFPENKSSQMEEKEEDKLELESGSFDNRESILKVIIKCIINDVGENYKYLKREIIKYFQQKSEYHSRHCILILERLYFRDHLNSAFLHPDHEYIKKENRNLEKLSIIQNEVVINKIETEEDKEKYDEKWEVKEQINMPRNIEMSTYKIDQTKDNREFIFVLEKQIFPLFQAPLQCLRKNSWTYIIEKIQRDLTNNYFAFVEDVDKLLEKEFEDKFGINDPISTMEQIRNDLDQVRRQIDQMKLSN